MVAFNIFWLLIFNPFLQGRVLDSETKTPIPYAYIQFLDDGGTYITTNAEGEFQFDAIGNRQKGRLYVRSLGYEETTLDYDINNGTSLTIELQPKVFELPELEVRDRNVTTAILGEKNAPTNGVLNYMRNPAILFNLNKEKGQLTKLHFSLSEKDGIAEAPMLINVYTFISNKNNVRIGDFIDLNDLSPAHRESIVFEGGVPGWNIFDLEPFELQFEKCWVLIHFIYPTDDPRYAWKLQTTFRGEKRDTTYYGPSINTYSGIKTRDINSFYYREGSYGAQLKINPLFRTNRFKYIPAVALEYDKFN